MASFDVSDRDFVLQELSHRFFNSLQVIDSLLAAALRAPADEDDARYRLQAIRSRVLLIAKLHRRVARERAFGELLESHCRDVCIDLVRCFGREDVTPWLEISEVNLSMAREQQLVQLIVELVSNSLKHSRSDGYGIIWVDLNPCGEGLLELNVRDNGASVPPLEFPSPPRIAHALALRLGGALSVAAGDGFAVRVRFPIAEPTEHTMSQAPSRSAGSAGGATESRA
jgi:two-component sensor histidine kinase